MESTLKQTAVMSEPFLEKNKKPLAIAAIMIASAAMLTWYNFAPERKFDAKQKYFSDDDGKTWYADSVEQIPPYTHNGKPANAAVIFSYANGSKQFCGYLLRFPKSLKEKIEAEAAGGANQNPPVTAAGLAYGTETSLMAEVKPPLKDVPWKRFNSREAMPIISVKSPDGSELDSVLP